MAENLKITTPVTSGDHTTQIKGSKNPTPIGNIDPTKVLSKNPNSAADEKSNGLRFDNSSYFQSFVDKLKGTQPLSQTIGKLLAGTLNDSTPAALKSDVQKILSQLAGTTVMNEDQMLKNLLFQQKNATGFQAELFQVLRSVSDNGNPGIPSRSPGIPNDCIGRFLKAYDGYTTANETYNSIVHQLEKILDYIPKSYRAPIEKAMTGLTEPKSEEAIEHNLAVLKGQILPTLGKYISAFNDFGETRNKLSLIIHNISRLNISTRTELETRFNELMEYMKYELNIPAQKLGIVQRMFDNALTGSAAESNEFIDALVRLLTADEATGAGLSSAGRNMLREAVQSFLLDYNVFMPFHHLFLPVTYNGRQMFSDIWIEKTTSSDTDSDKPKKIYINFDIADTGSFQAEIELFQNNLDCKLYLPEKLQHSADVINKDIGNIFALSGFKNAAVTTVAKEMQIKSAIMSSVYERRSFIDVTV